MKLIKKIAAIMFAFMMVFSLSTNVKATSGSQTDNGNKGTITIDKAIDGQEYKIYKIFDLESFDTEPTPDGAYLYKITDAWRIFFTKGEGKDYVKVDDNDYVTWRNGVSKDKAAELSKKALDYAKTITPTRETTANGTSVTFDKLDYGYYLVDSSLGALCGLTTTQPDATISEKNNLPTLTKHIEINGHEYNENSANIGDTITFNIHVSIPKGTDKCILTDEMNGLEFTGSPHTNDGSAYVLDVVPVGGIKPGEDGDYIFTKTSKGFTISFTKKYLDSINDEDPRSVFITYNAKLKNTAEMGNDSTANTNTAWLTYGDHDTKSTPVTTNTYTYEFPVLKYTGSVDNPTLLSGAEFKLYSDYDCKHEIKLANAGKNIYRYLIDGDTVANIVTDATGKFKIQGLAEDTYYLKETKAPHGYNKLETPITVELQKQPDGTSFMLILQDNKPTDTINVLNKSGSILPSTGGMGTTLIYLIGGALVLGSGFVLANKKRAKAK